MANFLNLLTKAANKGKLLTAPCLEITKSLREFLIVSDKSQRLCFRGSNLGLVLPLRPPETVDPRERNSVNILLSNHCRLPGEGKISPALTNV